MDFDEINKILELMRAHGLAEFELERDDLHIRLRKAETPVVTPPGLRSAGPEDVNRASATAEAVSGGTGESGATIVKAPILGTFYRASAPDASPFVEVGDVVKPGDVLCIIEAMKLMNEIQAEEAGTITQILAKNAEPVEYDQPLFVIEK